MRVATAAGPVSLEQTGDGPDLVLLHSLLTDRHVFDLILPALAEHRRVSLVDLPGFGDTPAVEPTIDAFADVVGGLLEAGGFDPATTALLGNGLGGFVAVGTAIRHGDKFDRLVLAGCGSSIPPEGKGAFRAMIERVAEGGMAAVVDQALHRIFTADYLEAHPEKAEERHRVLLQTDPAAFIAACRALHDLDYDHQVGAITNPTLLVVGSEDQATPPPLSRNLHAAISGSQYVELEGVAHAPQLQDPDRFVGVVESFLAS